MRCREGLVAAIVVLAACGGTSKGDDPASDTTARPPADGVAPFEVDVVTETFVDTSRPTAATDVTSAVAAVL